MTLQARIHENLEYVKDQSIIEKTKLENQTIELQQHVQLIHQEFQELENARL